MSLDERETTGVRRHYTQHWSVAYTPEVDGDVLKVLVVDGAQGQNVLRCRRGETKKM